MKNFKSFISGMLVMAMAICLAGSASAASDQIQVSKAGIVLSNKIRVQPGARYVSTDGREAPAVLTYTDSSGRTTDYVPLTLLDDLVDIESSWSEKRNCIVLGQNLDGVQASFEVYPGGKMTSKNPSSPVLGEKVGPFTTVAPSAVDQTQPYVGCDADKERIQGRGYEASTVFLAETGKYVVLEVTNNGDNSITCYAGRERTLGIQQRFSEVDIAPGKTLTWAFQADENAETMKSVLYAGIRGTDVLEGVDATFSMKQYQ